MQAVFKVTETTGWDVKHLAASEVRIIILYCTQREASSILEAAEKSGLTSNKYLWLVTQSVIGDPGDRSINRRYLPVGMLGECELNTVGELKDLTLHTACGEKLPYLRVVWRGQGLILSLEK